MAKAAGFTINAKTLYWWLERSDEARAAICQENKTDIVTMCTDFKNWLLSIDDSGQKLRLWGNGASFDNAIVRHAFRQCGNHLPIEYWNDRDMRTILGFYPSTLQAQYRKDTLISGTHHNALDDSKYQVKYCTHILNELGVTELY